MDGLNLSLPLRGNPEPSQLRERVSNLEPQAAANSGPKPNQTSFAKVLNDQDSGSRRVDTQDEKPSVKEKSDEKLEQGKGKKANSKREKAMLEFMDSMESEFGIPPQRIVEAMAQLPQQKMLQAPEDSAAQVIDALDLPPEQEGKAYSLYMGMLAQTAQTPTPAEPLMPSAMSVNLSRSNDLMAKDRRALLNDSLDQMNHKFFMQERAQAQAAMTEAGQMKPMAADDLVDRLSFERSQANTAIPQLKPQDGFLNKDLMSPQPDLTKGLEPVSEDQQEGYQNLIAKLSGLGAAAAATGKAAEQAQKGSQAPDVAAEQGAQQFGSSNLNLSSAAALGGMREAQSGGAGKEDSEGFGQKESSLKHESLGHLGRSDVASGEKTMGFKEVLQTSTPMAAGQRNDVPPNIEKIMNQAQIVARKGGGEATIRMSPEGLGEVHLKVVVKDGKVNLEMMTETKEAKKLIESSLSDLKLGLGGHKLSMESVKVDVGLQSSSDQSPQQQQQKNLDMNQGREQARQMFQQFRDDQMSKRESFFEMPGIKAYSRPNQGPSPMESSERAQSSRRIDGRGERMNLVA